MNVQSCVHNDCIPILLPLSQNDSKCCCVVDFLTSLTFLRVSVVVFSDIWLMVNFIFGNGWLTAILTGG